MQSRSFMPTIERFKSGIQILSFLAGSEQLRLPAAVPPISQFVIKFR
jgi:hypothetical protein